MIDVKAELRRQAVLTLTRARESMEQIGAFDLSFGYITRDGLFRFLKLPEQVREGMNSGEAKDKIFALMRMYVEAVGALGSLFAGEMFLGKTTPAARGLSREELNRLCVEPRFEEGVRRGLIKRTEAIHVVIQTPEFMIHFIQEFERDYKLRVVTFGPVDEHEMPQDQFQGREKMFGAPSKSSLL